MTIDTRQKTSYNRQKQICVSLPKIKSDNVIYLLILKYGGKQMRYCRNCQSQINENAEVCLNCGVKSGTGNRYCPNCGAQTNPEQVICVKCGVSLKNDEQNENKESKLHRSKKNKILAGVCGGLGEKSGVNPWVFRIGLIISHFLVFGLLLDIVYIIMIFALPKE